MITEEVFLKKGRFDISTKKYSNISELPKEYIHAMNGGKKSTSLINVYELFLNGKKWAFGNLKDTQPNTHKILMDYASDFFLKEIVKERDVYVELYFKINDLVVRLNRSKFGRNYFENNTYNNRFGKFLVNLPDFIKCDYYEKFDGMLIPFDGVDVDGNLLLNASSHSWRSIESLFGRRKSESYPINSKLVSSLFNIVNDEDAFRNFRVILDSNKKSFYGEQDNKKNQFQLFFNMNNERKEIYLLHNNDFNKIYLVNGIKELLDDYHVYVFSGREGEFDVFKYDLELLERTI